MVGNPQASNIASRRKPKCTVCGKEGHKANNRFFHPEGNPNAKVGPARGPKKNAIHQPPRNTGEIDDEKADNDVGNDSEEDSNNSDTDSDEDFAEQPLIWKVDDQAHDPVDPGVNGQFGHPLPPFQGPDEGIYLGDILDIDPDGSLLPVFNKFFNNDMFTTMGNATNDFGHLYVKKWKNLWRSELAAFIGLIVHMGLVNYNGPRHKLWENTWKGSVFVRTVMTEDRFEKILKAWHYQNYAEYTSDEIKQLKALDPFWPIASLENALNERFVAMMKPGQFLDIDEQCIPWKGRHKCRCYNKSKPVKRHFKVLSLNNSVNGYQERFYLYRGKAEERPANISATSFPAYLLLNHEKYQNKNHILFTDNWFTSFEQMKICMSYGIHMVGTVQKKRKGVPFSWKPAYGVQQVRNRGEFQSVQAIYYASEELIEDVYYTSWMDRKPVALLHTFPTKMGKCTRMVKTKNNGWQRLEYTLPTIIPIYNQGMVGTDSGDLRLEAYRPELKTISWVPCGLTHFLNMAIVNSFIWYSAVFPERKLSHYQFRERLIDDLVKAQLEKQVKEDANIFPRSLSKKVVQGAEQTSWCSLASPVSETSRQ